MVTSLLKHAVDTQGSPFGACSHTSIIKTACRVLPSPRMRRFASRFWVWSLQVQSACHSPLTPPCVGYSAVQGQRYSPFFTPWASSLAMCRFISTYSIRLAGSHAMCGRPVPPEMLLVQDCSSGTFCRRGRSRTWRSFRWPLREHCRNQRAISIYDPLSTRSERCWISGGTEVLSRCGFQGGMGASVRCRPTVSWVQRFLRRWFAVSG